MISPIVYFLAGFTHFIILAFVLYQISATAAASRETQQNTERMVLLLTVMANKQGASDDDIKKALGR
ncbi:MAG: hypothetical protein EB084_07065 [Proteobacteria bacterium]|nr:hypothetical protein [Pseudomonadota bacterium]